MSDLATRAKMQAAMFHGGIEPEPTLRECGQEIERLQHHCDEQSKDIRGYVERENKLQAENERLRTAICDSRRGRTSMPAGTCIHCGQPFEIHTCSSKYDEKSNDCGR